MHIFARSGMMPNFLLRTGLAVLVLSLAIHTLSAETEDGFASEGDPDMDMDTPDTKANTDEIADDETTDESDNGNMYEDTDGAVKELTWDEWIETVVEEEELPWLVNMYATWCT